MHRKTHADLCYPQFSFLTTAIAPIERARFVLLLQNSFSDLPDNQRYTGVVDALRRIPKEHGLTALWRGNLTNVMRYFPNQALNFAFRDTFKDLFLEGVDKDTQKLKYFLGSLASGGAAGGSSLAIIYPLNQSFTRTTQNRDRMSHYRYPPRRPEFNRIRDFIGRHFVSKHGLDPQFIGLTFVGTMVYRALFFGGFDIAKEVTFADSSNAYFFLLLAVAHVTTITADWVSYPIVTIRKHMVKLPSHKAYQNSLSCAIHIFKKEGAHAFFKGALSSLIYRTPGAVASALGLVLYDELQCK